jgi:hypothetical protein
MLSVLAVATGSPVFLEACRARRENGLKHNLFGPFFDRL